MGTRKAFNYDLYSKKVKMYYTGNTNPWNDIKKYLCSHGFEDRQYSGVISINPMTSYQATRILKSLNSKYPWLKKCIRRFDMTSIENEFDMSDFFKYKSKSYKKGLINIEKLINLYS